MEPDAPRVGVKPVTDIVSYGDVAEAGVMTEAQRLPVGEFSDFYRARRDRIARALALTIGDVDLAAEAADEALVRAYQRWHRVGAYDDPAAWAYRVGLNWATSVLRRRSRASTLPVEPGPDTEIPAMSEPRLLIALGELPVQQRAVIVCRYYLGLSEQETAAALRIRPGTVKSRLHRGLRQLQSRLAHLHPKEHS